MAIDLKTYIGQLRGHDWHHIMADEIDVYRKGSLNYERLYKIAEEGSIAFKMAFNEAEMQAFPDKKKPSFDV